MCVNLHPQDMQTATGGGGGGSIKLLCIAMHYEQGSPNHCEGYIRVHVDSDLHTCRFRSLINRLLCALWPSGELWPVLITYRSILYRLITVWV